MASSWAQKDDLIFPPFHVSASLKIAVGSNSQAESPTEEPNKLFQQGGTAKGNFNQNLWLNYRFMSCGTVPPQVSNFQQQQNKTCDETVDFTSDNFGSHFQ